MALAYLDLSAGIGAALVAATGVGLTIGAGTYSARWPTSQIYGRTLIAPRNPGEIALTFDDGPNPRWTPLLLETLAQHEIQATFFLMGKYASQQPDLVRRMHRAGHLIGNHTWNHPDLAMTDALRTRDELTRTSAELESILGSPVRYFRPPFGSRRPATLRIARELGLTPVMWNAMTTDWSSTSPDQVTPRLARLVEKHSRQGWASTIVLHDGGHLTLEADRSASVAAAGQLITRFATTHRFITVDAWQYPA